MGDRCYMTLTCRRSDAALFEAFGFTEDGAAHIAALSGGGA